MPSSPETTPDPRISRTAEALRVVVGKATEQVFRIENPTRPSIGWSRAKVLNHAGYGIIFAHMHANKGDASRMIKRIFDDPTFRERKLLLPNAMHQYQPWYEPVGATIAVDVYPVFTPETGRLAQQNVSLAEKLKKNYAIDLADARISRAIAERTRQYTENAIPHLQKGNIEAVAPQGHRERRFTTMTTAIESIVKRADREGIHNIAVLFVGYEIPGVEDYGEDRGYHLFTPYRFRDGRCLTVTQLMDEADGKIGQLGAVIRREMEKVVPPVYLP